LRHLSWSLNPYGITDKSSELVDLKFIGLGYDRGSPVRGNLMRVVALVAFVGFMGAIQMVYQNVAAQITSGEPNISLYQAPPILKTPIDWSKLQVGTTIDMKDIQRLNGKAMSGQVQFTTNRMQDVSAYMRNPAAWRGLPPR
jgi:hypothetical protein